jgi:rRNA biogenesis protein RRP5
MKQPTEFICHPHFTHVAPQLSQNFELSEVHLIPGFSTLQIERSSKEPYIMAPPTKKRLATDGPSSNPKKIRTSTGFAGPSSAKPLPKPPKADGHAALRPAPSFTSALRDEETDFPRGGGSSLTALEMKQVREEGRREAEAEAAQEVSGPVLLSRRKTRLICLSRRNRPSGSARSASARLDG